MFHNASRITSKILQRNSRLISSGLLLTGTSSSTAFCDEEERNFDETLRHYRSQFQHYAEKWNYENANSRLPTVSWPTNIPDEDTITGLQTDLEYCEKGLTTDKDADKKDCQDIQFRIASFLLLSAEVDVQIEGLAIVKSLAEKGHADGMCAYATCLNDGRAGLEINPKAAVSWWMSAIDMHDHIQSNYEVGVAFYTGEGVPENEELAVEYFRRAADCGHVGACYMLGDCLLDGIGVERDRGEALEWLVTSAELGHRGARSRVLAVLQMDQNADHGPFTDASRQTYIQSRITKEGKEKAYLAKTFNKGQKRDAEESQYSNRPVNLERRFTIGGGARNPQVLNRRKTIVKESREQ